MFAVQNANVRPEVLKMRVVVRASQELAWLLVRCDVVDVRQRRDRIWRCRS